MGKIAINMKAIHLFLLFAIIVMSYFIIRICIGYGHGFSNSEMDWDNNGTTSVNELIQSSDIGVRDVNKNGEICKEFYAYKDGLPIKVVCTTEKNRRTN